MAQVTIAGDDLIVDVEGLDKLWALKSRLTVPLGNVRGATADPGIVREPKGIRAPGTHVPGVVVAGSFYADGERVFWDVRDADKAIVITTGSMTPIRPAGDRGRRPAGNGRPYRGSGSAPARVISTSWRMGVCAGQAMGSRGAQRIKYPSAMSWKASARHGVREAPAGLALLQELINTRATMSYGPDLLLNADDAQRWLTEALATWSRVSGLPAPRCSCSRRPICGRYVGCGPLSRT